MVFFATKRSRRNKKRTKGQQKQHKRPWIATITTQPTSDFEGSSAWIRDLRYGRTFSENLKSGRKKHPSPSTRPQPQKRATFLIEAAAAASINLLLLLLLGICHLGSYNNIFLANYAYVYYNEGSYPFFSHNTIWMCTVWWRRKRWSNKTINCEERFVKGNHFLNIGVLTTINPFIRIPRCRWIMFLFENYYFFLICLSS